MILWYRWFLFVFCTMSLVYDFPLDGCAHCCAVYFDTVCLPMPDSRALHFSHTSAIGSLASFVYCFPVLYPSCTMLWFISMLPLMEVTKYEKLYKKSKQVSYYI
jgi:hypothetical protein